MFVGSERSRGAFLRSDIADLLVYSLCCRRPKPGHDRILVAAMQQIADWLKELGMGRDGETSRRWPQGYGDEARRP